MAYQRGIMNSTVNNKLILFGAGKIGRSFVAQLFSSSGYEVVFVDINESLIAQINSRNSYNVILRSESDRIIQVSNVRGILSDDISSIKKSCFQQIILRYRLGKMP